MDIDWAAPAGWDKHSPEFGDLRVHDDGRMIVVMEYVAPIAPRTRELWLDLPRHPNILDAIHASDKEILLRYAALNWWQRRLDIDSGYARATIAGWAVQLATVFGTIIKSVSPKDYTHFLSPSAWLDLDGEARVAFSTGDTFRPPDRKVDERSFVYVVGQVMKSLVETVPDAPIGNVIARCIEAKPSDRFTHLYQLESVCRQLARPEPIRVGKRAIAFEHIEEGIGWLGVMDVRRAKACFSDASSYSMYERYWQWGLQHTGLVLRPTVLVDRTQLKATPVVRYDPQPPPPPVFPTPPMTPARASYLEGREHFLSRRFHEARVCFASAILLDPMMLEAQLLRREVDRAIARTRERAGTPNAQPIDVPASLREVREIVVAGRIKDAIAVLSTTEYADNSDAALFRARLLAVDGQHARAASAYASIDDGPHRDEARLGLARITIDRGKPDAALTILDELLATRPRDFGALEARARCLELLGRTDEASEAMKAFVAAVELASDARLARIR